MLNPGEVLNNRYLIIKPLGLGGFGAVYRAEDLTLKTTCALKENLDYWTEAQRQFEREALLLAQLRHPNLPRVTDYFSVPAQGQYLVMDFVEGYDLQMILDRVGRPLSEKQVLLWIDQICDALIYLHAQTSPIIHRDIKPANIKITPLGQAMLVDFGIAKEYKPSAKTTVGAQAVTPGFSPPEQYGEGTTDPRTDIYSLGATVYTLLTGQRPPESVARATGEQMAAPRNLNPLLSSNIERAILRAMAVRANDRYQNMEEFRDALKKGSLDVPTQPRDKVLPLYSEPISRPVSSPITRPPSGMSVAAPLLGTPSSRLMGQATRSAIKVEWITIPAGEFLLGKERKKVQLPAFRISRFPITNLQYKIFLNANSKHSAPSHWRDRNVPLGKERHPVVGVSYHDAVAFCKWMECRLPGADEWEKAARGVDGRSFPWGEEWEDGKYCNHWAVKAGGTTPIDRFADGASPFGCWDMLGNVWEWTASQYQGPHMHVVRGGSWRTSTLQMHVTYSLALMLGDTRDDLGFRVALSL